MGNQEYKIEDVQRIIGYRFNNIELLKRAFTHSSYANDHKMNKTGSNERLEFLGDAVLELVSSEFLYDKYPEKPEGELTKLRASLVSESPLAAVASELGLGNYILLGKGEDNTGGRQRDSITSDLVEAVLGAIYLDGGMEPAKAFVLKYILNDIENKKMFYDCKTVLQELVQKHKMGTLDYILVGETGPDHMKVYEVNCRIDNQVVGNGRGRTKKAAQQKAAYDAISKIKKY
ncbi:MAG: ribonuclease III [Lachnospiraceae bacterium]|nr:ribonuclease III [Lachnospiraceae bacterium]